MPLTKFCRNLDLFKVHIMFKDHLMFIIRISITLHISTHAFKSILPYYLLPAYKRIVVLWQNHLNYIFPGMDIHPDIYK